MSFLSDLMGLGAQNIEGIDVLEISEYKKAIQDNVQLVDVRTPEEYQRGTIKNALNLDYFDQGSFREGFAKMDKSKPVYVFCRSGQRSFNAAKVLKKMGFIQIYDLKGGYLAWEKNF
ncbi:rhodanese-like domain-containing protein [Mangrovimonas sp. AS39]|uniref:rhodanese-like domain-containing protein n=1 Tax=Mangrovimonas futianensis TaxID=2895523 RepID=UPI001E2927FB|nr:rhodanese-like domain-containing protein [Mangrovimonas futianensis]MCF1191512.1 rhodanese-like domain-containing protein [Mangrovimonas futianensis]MCF1195207.1 rhodanese-like domain-containing protein [Mangrovimonas futianensis]MCF1421114.1 rhodanese-like domain-containing protein [Mangrovimonas futianensis]